MLLSIAEALEGALEIVPEVALETVPEVVLPQHEVPRSAMHLDIVEVITEMQ